MWHWKPVLHPITCVHLVGSNAGEGFLLNGLQVMKFPLLGRPIDAIALGGPEKQIHVVLLCFDFAVAFRFTYASSSLSLNY